MAHTYHFQEDHFSVPLDLCQQKKTKRKQKITINKFIPLAILTIPINKTKNKHSKPTLNYQNKMYHQELKKKKKKR